MVLMNVIMFWFFQWFWFVCFNGGQIYGWGGLKFVLNWMFGVVLRLFSSSDDVDDFVVVFCVEFDCICGQSEQCVVVVMVDVDVGVEVCVVLVDDDFVGEDLLVVEVFYVEVLCVGVMIVMGGVCVFFVCYVLVFLVLFDVGDFDVCEFLMVVLVFFVIGFVFVFLDDDFWVVEVFDDFSCDFDFCQVVGVGGYCGVVDEQYSGKFDFFVLGSLYMVELNDCVDFDFFLLFIGVYYCVNYFIFCFVGEYVGFENFMGRLLFVCVVG